MRERGNPTDGFGQHSIPRGTFNYARDSVGDHPMELDPGGDHASDPGREPVR